MQSTSPEGLPAAADATSTRLGPLIRAFFATPNDPSLVEEHQRTVLFRATFTCWLAAVVIPFTILVYVSVFRAAQAYPALLITGGAEVAIAALLGSLRAGLFRRRHHLVFFLLAGICNVTEVLVLELTGGGPSSFFFFPYFLILFGLAVLFPSRFEWAVACVIQSPVSYAVGELMVRGSISGERSFTNTILLVDGAFMAAIASRITTRLFFSEVENRLALVAANEQLREVDRAKSDFFANISHDLRSPLTTVLGPLNSVVADTSSGVSPKHRKYLELALRSAARVERMIDDVLELARIDAGVGKLNLSRADLRDLVSEIVQAVEPYATSLDIKLTHVIPDGPVYCVIDTDKVERVLMNLILNACKFSEAGTTVSLRLEEQDANVAFTVSDQGPGIVPEERHRIFERFVRGKSGVHPHRIRGSGLGLAVVKEFVELHHGTIEVSSVVGQGSHFTVLLPRTQPAWTARSGEAPVIRSRPPARLLVPEAAARGATPAPRAGPRLLLVEDDDTVRRYLKSEIGDAYVVIEAADGLEALRAVGDRPPDLILADVVLPGLSGIELCQNIRDTPGLGDLPVVLMSSARTDIETRLNAFAAGADDFVNKPIDSRELTARLEAIRRRSEGRSSEPAAPVGARTGSA